MRDTTSGVLDRPSPPAAAPTRRPRLRTRSVSPLELGLAALGLALAVGVVLGDHVLHGGFELDDWSVYSDTVLRGGSVWSDIDHLVGYPNIANRPLTGVFWAVGMNVLGIHMGWWLGFVAILAVWMGTTVFALLRMLGIGTAPAFAVGALSVLTPASDSLRLWIAAGAGQLPITLALSGIALALLAFRARTRGWAIALHATSILLYALSLLLVETSLALMAAAGLLYLLVAPRKPALGRWGLDLVVLGGIYALVTSNTSYARQPLDGAIRHVWIIVDQARVLLTSTVLPFGNGSWWALALVALVLAAAGAVAVALPRGARERTLVWRLLALAGGGVMVIALGYAPYAAADPYYSPLTAGMGNRTNGLASVGWAMLLVSVVVLAATLAFRGLPRAPRLTAGLAAIVLACVAVQYASTVRDDGDNYQRAYGLAANTLGAVKAAVPKPPGSSMFYVSGAPLEVALGVPVFNATWDLDGALKFAYRRYDVRGLPVLTGLELTCAPDRIVPKLNGVEQSGFASSYRRTYFVDGVSGARQRVDDPRACRDASANWPRNPALPAQ